VNTAFLAAGAGVGPPVGFAVGTSYTEIAWIKHVA
jgi:hypothetical protein